MTEPTLRPPGFRRRAASFLRSAIEAGVLVLVCASPWALGGVEPGAEFCLFAGLAVLLALWAVRLLLDGELTWAFSPVGVSLAGLFLFGVLQVVPLPAPVLAWVSPTSAHFANELLPGTHETLPFDEPAAVVSAPAGATISLCPAVTRVGLVRLLAVFLLFAVVRNNCATSAALRRFALAAVLNGFALALFAYAQFFSSPPDKIYWTYPVLNFAFGPFIDRDHFPFYVNLCIGLGIGLLLALWKESGTADRPAEKGFRDWLTRPLEILNAPAALGVSLALAFMVSSVFFSLSRGGILSLVGATALLLAWRALRPGRGGRTFRPEAAFLIGMVALGLLVWFGLGPIQARLATLWKGEALADARLPVWWDGIKAAKDFPLFGTGTGTFLDVDLTYRTRTVGYGEGWDNAHNDYVEALVEGGAVRLLLSLTIIGLVYRQGWRALRRYRGRSAHGLVEGALVAFTTVVLHSFVDFGLHVQAIAVLATVVAAHLCALGSKENASPAADAGAFRLGGLAPVAGALTLLALGWVLCTQGWRWAAAYGLEVAARNPQSTQQRLDLLDAAARTDPNRPHLHLVAGQAYLDAYQERLAAGPTTDQPVRDFLTPALRHYLQARDLSPLIAKPHMQLAAYREWLGHADPRSVYLHRAEIAYPRGAEVWYLAGVLEEKDGDRSTAASSWRRSLELSPKYLSAILERARPSFDDEQLVRDVLPARADTLCAAADYLHPGTDARRQPFLRAALTALDAAPEPLSATDLHLRARAEAELGLPGALASYETALRHDPQQDEWRYEYAVLLHRQGKLSEARSQLQLLLGRKPDHRPARDLLDRVAREGARGG